jgi:hypothetical protein
MASRSKKKVTVVPSWVFKAVKQAYDQNLGMQYYEEHKMSNTDFLVVQEEEDREYRVFTKFFCLKLECEVVIDNDENESGTWQKEYRMSDLSRAYGMDTAKMEDMINFINENIIKIIP